MRPVCLVSALFLLLLCAMRFLLFTWAVKGYYCLVFFRNFESGFWENCLSTLLTTPSSQPPANWSYLSDWSISRSADIREVFPLCEASCGSSKSQSSPAALGRVCTESGGEKQNNPSKVTFNNQSAAQRGEETPPACGSGKGAEERL